MDYWNFEILQCDFILPRAPIRNFKGLNLAKVSGKIALVEDPIQSYRHYHLRCLLIFHPNERLETVTLICMNRVLELE